MADLNTDLEEPSEITSIELEEITAKLLDNVAQAMENVFRHLDDRENNILMRLAYHDAFELEMLQDKVRDAIRERGDGEPAANRFTMSRYKQYAKATRKKFEEGKRIRAEMEIRGIRVVDGSAPDPEVDEIKRAAPGDTKTQAKLYSSSAFLKAMGTLQAQRKGRVWFDEFHNNFFTDWLGASDDRVVPAFPIDDAWILNCYEWLLMCDVRLASSLSKGPAEDAIHQFGYQDRRNEPREWLKGLKWDNTPRLCHWLMKTYGVADDRHGYHAAVGRCWIVAMVSRIMVAGSKVDTMPVLIGPEGTEKSTSLEILGGKWYATVNTSADKLQDFLMILNGKLLVEIAELDAISRSTDTRIKTLLSTATDNFRPPYGRVTKEFARTAMLSGSTNDLSWHKEGGVRRYWPVVCRTKIDTAWLRENRDQLFAEAKALYDRGHSKASEPGCWWDVPESEQERRVIEHTQGDPWQDQLQAYIDSHTLWTGPDCDVPRVFGDPASTESEKRWGTVITTSRLLTEALVVPIERQNRSSSIKVAQGMRNMGFEHVKVRVNSTKTAKLWIVPQLGEGEFSQLSLLPSDLDA